MKIGFFLIFFSISLSWADCQMSNGRTIVKISENKEVSLFGPGKALENHKIQDQDGLGTCYANATTAVLKSVLPGHPDVSYMHAALQSATNGWRQNWSTGNKKYIKENQQDFTYGGFFCETIAALKKAGGACPVENSILENRQLVNNDIQKELMKSLGTYFDSLNQVKNDPSKLQKLRENLALVVDSVKLERSKILQLCESEKAKDIPLKRALDDAISSDLFTIDLSSESTDECGKYRAERFKEILGSKTIISEDTIKLNIPPSLEAELESFLRRDPMLVSELSEHLKLDEHLAKGDKNFQQKLGLKVSEFINSKLNSPSIIPSSCPAGDSKRNVQSEPEDMGAMFFDGMYFEKSKPCDSYIQNTAIIEAVKESSINQCISEGELDQMMNGLIPLMKVGEALDDSLINKLSNPLSQQGKQLKDILIPGCADKSKLIDMKNVSCASFSMCDKSKSIDMSNTTYSGPEGGCYDFGSARSLVRTRVLNNISSNRPLGISVCTAFMDNPAARTNFCQTPVQGVDGHSNHEMTISGYRCKNGKVEYQILNSWGRYRGCPVSEGNKNSAIECSLDKEGDRDGKFWIKEDVLVDSTNEISQLSSK